MIAKSGLKYSHSSRHTTNWCKVCSRCESQATWLGNMSSIESKHDLQHLVTVLRCCCRIQSNFEGGWHQHHSSGLCFRGSCIQPAACPACVQRQPEPAEPDSASAGSRRAALLCLSAARACLSTSSCNSVTSHKRSVCHANFSDLPQPRTQHCRTVIVCCVRA